MTLIKTDERCPKCRRKANILAQERLLLSTPIQVDGQLRYTGTVEDKCQECATVRKSATYPISIPLKHEATDHAPDWSITKRDVVGDRPAVRWIITVHATCQTCNEVAVSIIEWSPNADVSLAAPIILASSPEVET